MWTCPSCDREFPNKNQGHYCARVSIESLFVGKAQELSFLFDKLLSVIIDWNGVTVSATPNCIVFVHHKTFLVIRPMKNQLHVKFYSEVQHEGFPVIKSIACSGKFENHIRLAALDELTQTVYSLIKQSYFLL